MASTLRTNPTTLLPRMHLGHWVLPAFALRDGASPSEAGNRAFVPKGQYPSLYLLLCRTRHAHYRRDGGQLEESDARKDAMIAAGVKQDAEDNRSDRQTNI